ncbi:MAG: transposase [Paludibacter sp.]|nr:transposase [Paludibacter sp.]
MKTDKFNNKYRIPSARAVWHDYNGGDYFITICTAGRMHYFGEIENGEMVLNILGKKLDELIKNIKIHYPYSEIPVYKIMPNHVHLIVCIAGACRDVACRVSANNPNDFCIHECAVANTKRDAACHVSTGDNEKMRNIAEKCGLLSTVMGGLKSTLTKYANNNNIQFGWQTRFHDHIIRNQKEMNLIVSYIENNPTTWENDTFYSKR